MPTRVSSSLSSQSRIASDRSSTSSSPYALAPLNAGRGLGDVRDGRLQERLAGLADALAVSVDQRVDVQLAARRRAPRRAARASPGSAISWRDSSAQASQVRLHRSSRVVALEQVVLQRAHAERDARARQQQRARVLSVLARAHHLDHATSCSSRRRSRSRPRRARARAGARRLPRRAVAHGHCSRVEAAAVRPSAPSGAAARPRAAPRSSTRPAPAPRASLIAAASDGLAAAISAAKLLEAGRDGHAIAAVGFGFGSGPLSGESLNGRTGRFTTRACSQARPRLAVGSGLPERDGRHRPSSGSSSSCATPVESQPSSAPGRPSAPKPNDEGRDVVRHDLRLGPLDLLGETARQRLLLAQQRRSPGPICDGAVPYVTSASAAGGLPGERSGVCVTKRSSKPVDVRVRLRLRRRRSTGARADPLPPRAGSSPRRRARVRAGRAGCARRDRAR